MLSGIYTHAGINLLLTELIINKLQHRSRLTPSFGMTLKLFVRSKPVDCTDKKATVRTSLTPLYSKIEIIRENSETKGRGKNAIRRIACGEATLFPPAILKKGPFESLQARFFFSCSDQYLSSSTKCSIK